MNIFRKFLFMLILFISWSIFPFTISKAQPTRDKILADVQIKDNSECAIIQVGFNFPVRYKKHFPYESGAELRIQIEPIAVSPVDREALHKHESVTPPESHIVAIEDIVYEGDVVGDPFLTLLFEHPVSFKVEQGADYRSLTITVFLPSATAPCIPATK